MKEEIKKDIMQWYQDNNNKHDFKLEELTDKIIDKTTDILFEKIRIELENEFREGNLKQPLTISDEYYLQIKLKDIKNRCINKPVINTSENKDEKKEEGL